ncbi:MarR family winged helix-turn-helix transcriptional regulator [Streptomyces sp. NPDC086787]|uniref:MarR family winged helix-turn-helix transcriptional regulator n=1 Tax=Streptomyces sp. NPDC086787 TaxID=3365759 RepID=UPI0037F5B742
MSDEIALLVANVFEAAGALRRSGDALAAGLGQSQARWQLLSVASGNPVTVAQASRRLGVTRQGVQRIANDLVREDLAAFQPNPDHRTSPLLALTPAGDRVLREITERATEVNRILATDLSPDEITTARSLLRLLTDRVRQLEHTDALTRESGRPRPPT